jgi:hypothetical protein
MVPNKFFEKINLWVLLLLLCLPSMLFKGGYNMTNKAQPGHSVNNFIRIFNVLTERNLSFHINQVENGRKETFSLFNSRNISKQKQYF